MFNGDDDIDNVILSYYMLKVVGSQSFADTGDLLL